MGRRVHTTGGLHPSQRDDMNDTLFDDFATQRKGRQSDEYYTPKWVFDALGTRFDLDVCAPEQGPAYTPADRWYSLKDDGLISPWFGRVWMNPPFSNTTPWMHKWLDHGNGICLVPAAKSKWHNTVWESNAVCLLLPSTLKFVTPMGTDASIFIQCLLWAIGEECTKLLRNSGLGKVR